MKLTVLVEGFLVYIMMNSVFLSYVQKKRGFSKMVKFFAILFLPLKPRFTVKMHHITFEKKWQCSFPEVKNIQLLIDNDGRKPIAIGNLS